MAASTVKSGSNTTSEAAKKKFACSHPDCGKSFSRSEHLHRHSLNHKEGTNTCTRCSAHFRRRDLLEKDDEAGGEGLGHLATRKRLWRDEDGKIIQGRRPHVQDGLKRRQSSSASSISDRSVASEPKRRRTIEIAPPSPESSTSIQSPCEPLTGHLQQDSLPIDSSMASNADNGDQFDFLCTPSWSSQPFQQSMPSGSADLPYNDIFKSENVSYDAPFTTMNYYSWLYENDSQNATPSSPEDAALAQERMPVISAASSYASSPRHMSGSLSPTSVDPHLLSTNNFEDSFAITGHGLPLSTTREFPIDHSLLDPAFVDDLASGDYGSPEEVMFSLNYEPKAVSTMFSEPQLQDSYQDSCASTPPSHRSSVSSPVLSSAYLARTVGQLPLITNEARMDLMAIIKQAKPARPDGSEIKPSDPLLSLMSLQHYLDLFFTRFNSSYPLIPQATFRSSEVHPFLLMTILLLGATYSDKEAQTMAVCLNEIMRPLIHASKDSGTRPKLWMLQTILLSECFGKSRAGEKLHDMSELYHGLFIE